MTAFDIPADRLADLTGADLRELVARLCEAELERQGRHRSEVRWGGSQTAADGGLDVVVELSEPISGVNLLTQRNTGIQVKKRNLACAAIKSEMCPHGRLRPAISGLAAKSGSYLIASAGANCSEKMLNSRINAMRKAVAEDPNGDALELAFLDRNFISRWASAHPSVVAWLRGRLELPYFTGWQPFGRWSSTPEEETDDLICEEGLAFHIEGNAPIRNLPKALDTIRNLVRSKTGAVRIVGLSGIGKSRIVQALFEPVGDVAALPASHAIYTDVGHCPDPSPMTLLNLLVERNAPAILIVDNCPPNTHQALSRKLAERSSPVLFVSVEYDVRADRPEHTDVVRIEAEGCDIVAALICRRHSNLSLVDAQRLATFSQGNARLGLALAQAAPKTGTLSTFDDAALFDRLFWQRARREEELARAAKVLSLVYSFEVEGEEEPDELAVLGSLAELSRLSMYRHAANLRDRGLAQARSRWRAILPHALANRLARQALQSIPWRRIAGEFADKPRLRRSFGRRLSYLHDSAEARRIVLQWMEKGGPLSDTTTDIQLLEFVCHLAPDEALRVIDDMMDAIQIGSGDARLLETIAKIIFRIAHSEDMFPRACQCLTNLSIKVEGIRVPHADRALAGLFRLYLSGTLAQTDTRIRVAREFLWAKDPKRNERGIAMLRAALRTGQWTSSMLHVEDARPDASGWEPDEQETVDWFNKWLDLAAEIALCGSPEIGDSARNALADEIELIWKRVPALRQRIDKVARELHAVAPWPEGRHAFRTMLSSIRRRGEDLPNPYRDSIGSLIDHMEPKDLEGRVRAEIVKGWDMEFENEDEERSEVNARHERSLIGLGRELASDLDTLRAVGRELFEADGRPFGALGVGLAMGAERPMDIWAALRGLLSMEFDEIRQIRILSGFVQQLDISSPAMAEKIRAECREMPTLRVKYDALLPINVLSAEEMGHVIEIAGEPNVPARQFSSLVWSEKQELSDADRVRLLRAILDKTDGPGEVVSALEMLRFIEGDSRDCWPQDLRTVGLDAIVQIFNTDDLGPNTDDSVSSVLAACLRGDNGSDAAYAMDMIANYAAKRYGSTYGIERTLATLAERSPEIFLSRAFPDRASEPTFRFRDDQRFGPLLHVPVEALIEWCKQDPDRWERVTPQISPFSSEIGDEDEAGQISSFAIAFLKAAPRPEDVIRAYLQQIAPMNWSGSRADIMERRLNAMETADELSMPEFRHVISRIAPDIRARIGRIREAEQEEEREWSQRDQRFE